MEGEEPSVWRALEPSSSGLPDSEPAGRCGHGALPMISHMCSSSSGVGAVGWARKVLLY